MSVCPVGHRDRKKILFMDLFCQQLKMKHLIGFGLTFKNLYCQHFEHMSSCGVSVCPVGHRDEEEQKIFDFFSQRFKKSNYFMLFFTFFTL